MVSGQGPVWAPRLRLPPAKIGKSTEHAVKSMENAKPFLPLFTLLDGNTTLWMGCALAPTPRSYNKIRLNLNLI